MSDKTIAEDIERRTGMPYRDAMEFLRRNFNRITEEKNRRGCTRREAAIALAREDAQVTAAWSNLPEDEQP